MDQLPLEEQDDTQVDGQVETQVDRREGEQESNIIETLLATMVARDATDLHIQANCQPMMRVAGRLHAVNADFPSDSDISRFMELILNPTNRGELHRYGGCDLSFTFGNWRMRVNIFRQQRTWALAIRRLSLPIPSFAELNLPEQLASIAEMPRGLVLVSGTTSSGKSTTLAAMISHINKTSRKRIITIEDPIEYIHNNDQSIIAQIEIGPDTPDHTRAIRQSLRQDPDILLIGELRDPESVRVALRAADTGHLVFGAIHAGTSVQTIERIIALFGPDEHDLLLTQLSMNMQAIICQRLSEAGPKVDCALLPVVEILRGNAVTRRCILEKRYDGLLQAMANQDDNMQTFDQHIAQLYRDKKLTGIEALRVSTNPEALTMTLRGINTNDSKRKLVR